MSFIYYYKALDLTVLVVLSTIDIKKSKGNENNNQKRTWSDRLSGHETRCNNPILCIINDIKYPFGCILTFCQERHNLCIRLFLPRFCPQIWRTHHTQRYYFYPLHHPEICGIFSWGSRFRCTIHKHEKITQYLTALAELSHPQAPTSIHFENTIAVRIAYGTIRK